VQIAKESPMLPALPLEKITRLVRDKSSQGRKTLSVASKTYRNDANRPHTRMESSEFIDGSIQVLAVVQTGHQHYLGVQFDPTIGKVTNYWQDIRRTGVA
jgi:hypothetical protein